MERISYNREQMDEEKVDHPTWFNTRQIQPDLYLTTEDYYYEAYRANIWLIRGTKRDVLIDAGLGVCNLKKHLQKLNLLSDDRECLVICSHAHFDHSGGAHHFDHVLIHEDEYEALKNAEESATLNWSEAAHYREQPYQGFVANEYKVTPTKCTSVRNGDRINLDDGNDQLEIIHVPGHTPGSILCYYPKKKVLFTGDFIYQCEHGSTLYDWTPRASIEDYLRSAHYIIDWLEEHQIENLYAGHNAILDKKYAQKLLKEYIDSKA